MSSKEGFDDITFSITVMMEVCDLLELEAVSLSGCQDEKGVRGIFAPSAAAERGFNYFFFFSSSLADATLSRHVQSLQARAVKGRQRLAGQNKQAKPRLLDGKKGQVNLSDVRLYF